MGRQARDGKRSLTRQRCVRPLCMRRSLLDALWRSCGLTYTDAPYTVLPDSLTTMRGRKAGRMMWGMLQRVLRGVCEGRAKI